MNNPSETSAARYNVVTPDTGLQLSTVVDNETNQNILALDARTVDGISYSTPVFANTSMAKAVAGFLNSRSDAENKWIDVNGMGGTVCSACGMPTESEPCEEHQPNAYMEMTR